MLMSQVTTLGIGGPAKEFIVARTEEDLIQIIGDAQKFNQDFLIIGGGSNLLVSDEGIDKLIIKNEVAGIQIARGDTGSKHPRGGVSDVPQAKLLGGEVVVKSGTSLQELVDFTISHGLAGLQKMTGIPGTVGGAIYGNVGAYGQTISDNILNVVVLSERSPSGLSLRVEDESKDDLQTLSKNQCRFGYRDSSFKINDQIILEATFQLSTEDPQKLQQEAEEILSKRLVKYPPGLKCPGSFFKNILAETLPKEILEKIPADKIPYGKVSVGYLLEEVGAKGTRLGNIEVAPYHANLFINLGGGKAADFYNLAKKLAQKVKQKFGITLEPEVQLINLPPLI